MGAGDLGPVAGTPFAPWTRMRRALPILAAALLLACVSPPPHPRAVNQVSRGYAHLLAGDRERAEVAFEHALEMAPDLAEARAGLGVALRVDGRTPQALAQFDEAVSADPDLAEGHAGRGEALLALGQEEAGMAALADALRVDPDQVATRLIRSRHLARRAERASEPERRVLLERARRDLLHAIEANPRVALVHHDLGWVSWLQGDAAGAAASYGQAARLDPAMTEAWLGACASLAAAGRSVEAEAACARLAARTTGNEKGAPARTGAP